MVSEEKQYITEIVSRAVIIKDGKILIVNKLGESHYFLPGGRVEKGEGVSDGLVREIKEELDKDCVIEGYFGCIEDSYSRGNRTWYQLCHFFIVEIPGLNYSINPVSAESELVFSWHSINQLDSIYICPPFVIDLIRNAEKKQGNFCFWGSVLSAKSESLINKKG